MKVNRRDISFKSIYTNKALKKGLEFASDNGALFAASATVGFSFARPLSIWATPKTEKENRIIAASKSITSSLIGFLLMLGFSTPLAKSVKKIDKNPEKYLKPETIEKLKDKKESLTNSKGYIFATQLFKLGLGLVMAIPKSVLTCAGLPYVAGMFDKNIKNDFSPEENFNNSLSFKAKPNLAKTIGKILNKKSILDFSEKYKDTNFPMHIIAGTDLLSTAAFIRQTQKSKKIKEDRKPALMYNAGISTVLSIICGYITDKLLDKPTEKFINNFKKANIGKPNLDKQVQGIKIAKPILILGTIYYIFIPFVSTFLAEKAEK